MLPVGIGLRIKKVCSGGAWAALTVTSVNAWLTYRPLTATPGEIALMAAGILCLQLPVATFLCRRARGQWRVALDKSSSMA